jgi:MFS transporter, DHA1 family, tetracycline resistance protein
MLRSFQGNARSVIVTEPFFGVPFSLFSTYASVYMLALGCTATQIGLISSVGLVLAMALSLASGSITDRLGRKRTTLLFDFLSWSGAVLLWALSKSFFWFVAAAVVNSLSRVVQTSWTCLMIEDTPEEQRVHLYSWIYVVGVVAGLIAPLAGLFVEGFGLVPAMRGLYLFAFVSMTGMFIVRNTMVEETRIGLVKMKETRHTSAKAVLADYGRVAARLSRSPLTLVAFLISTLVNIQAVLKNTFLAILLTRGLSFSDASIAIFPAVGAAVTLVMYLLVLPTVSRWRTPRSMLVGLATSAAGMALLVICPPRSYVVVIASTLLTAAGSALMYPFSDTLVANTVQENDRAKALSLFYVALFALSAPFGYLGGLAFASYDRLPFILAAFILAGALGLALFIPRIRISRPDADA